MTRYWTLDEARAALKEVVPLLEELREIVRDRAGTGATREPAAPARTNGRHSSTNGRVHDGQTALLTRAKRLLDTINDLGVQMKDVEAGLIDFPYLRGGEEVLLCFRLGEDDISYWHSLEGGFAGRRPISEL